MADNDMIGPDDLGPEDTVILAGQFALGVLEGDDLASARRAMLADPTFAADVEWWENRLGTQAEHAGRMTPTDDVWSAIEARLETGGSVFDISEKRRSIPYAWSIGSALAGAAAASLALYILVPNLGVSDIQPVEQVQQSQLIAQLQDADTGRSLASRVDPNSNEISLRIAGLIPENAASTAAELWVVPKGGAPVSLGFIPGNGEFKRKLSQAEAKLLVEGATLAVTFEQRGEQTHEAPTTPILLAGALTRV